MSVWQLQEAKQRFSEVVREASEGEPQIVTRHGREVAAIIDIETFRRIQGGGRSFKEFLESFPVGDELELPPRDVPDRATPFELSL